MSGGLRTHCVNGHLRDEANTYIDPRGRKSCRECRRIDNRRRKKAMATNINATPEA